MIYFIGNIEHDVVKIGYTTDINKRIKQLLTSCPYKLTLLKSIEGDLCYEKQLHEHYKESNINREWFKLSNIDLNNIPIAIKELIRIPEITIEVHYSIINSIINTNEYNDYVCLNSLEDKDAIYTTIQKLYKKGLVNKVICGKNGNLIHKYVY